MTPLNVDPLNYGLQFVPNGYLVVASYTPESETIYQGIDDDTWPIESDNYRKLANQLGIPRQMEGVQVATRWPETVSYWRRCNSVRYNSRLLLLRTRFSIPYIIVNRDDWQSIGYDIADPLGQHSLLKNQVISGSVHQLIKWQSYLNEHGMLDSLELSEDFLAEYNALPNRVNLPPSPQFQFVPVSVSIYLGR